MWWGDEPVLYWYIIQSLSLQQFLGLDDWSLAELPFLQKHYGWILSWPLCIDSSFFTLCIGVKIAISSQIFSTSPPEQPEHQTLESLHCTSVYHVGLRKDLAFAEHGNPGTTVLGDRGSLQFMAPFTDLCVLSGTSYADNFDSWLTFTSLHPFCFLKIYLHWVHTDLNVYMIFINVSIFDCLIPTSLTLTSIY